jgi:hypothetical protein
MIRLCSRFDSVLFTPKMPAIPSYGNYSRSPKPYWKHVLRTNGIWISGARPARVIAAWAKVPVAQCPKHSLSSYRIEEVLQVNFEEETMKAMDVKGCDVPSGLVVIEIIGKFNALEKSD